MAWAEKLATGWRGRYRDQAGTKRKVTQADGSLFRRKRDAIEAAEEAAVKARREAAITAGTLSASITWGQWWEQLAATRTLTESDTAAIERNVIERYLLPQWGEVALNKIRQPDVQRWANDLTAGQAVGWERDRLPEASYVHRIYAVFAASMNRAVPSPLHASPCVGIKLPRVRKKPKQFMTQEYAEDIELRGDYQDAVDFGLETGLRPGELCGLHVHRVDLITGWLHVVEVLVARRMVIRPHPKDADTRAVPLSAKAIEIVRRRLAGRDLTQGCGLSHTDGTACTGDVVFRTERGRVMRPEELARRLRYAADRAGVPRRTAYSIRRGFGTRAARGGMDAFLLADIMGHADVRETRGYVQMGEDARAVALAALGERPPLRAVDGPAGQPGADRGADPSGKAPGSAGSRDAETAG